MELFDRILFFHFYNKNMHKNAKDDLLKSMNQAHAPDVTKGVHVVTPDYKIRQLPCTLS